MRQDSARATLPTARRPCLTLRTLGRGDGLLGMMPNAPLGPRGPEVTIVSLDADSAAMPEATHRLRALGLHPVPPEALQWRAPEVALPLPRAWTLLQEDLFGAFWAEQVPVLQAEGWLVAVRPGFAHLSVPVQAWRLVLSADDGDAPGLEPRSDDGAGTMPLPPAPTLLPAGPGGGRLTRPTRAWVLSLGVEIDGEPLDLAPLLADLLKRDARWSDATALAALDDATIVLLHAPGGRRIEAPAAPLKAIVGAMLELLTDPLRRDGPLRLSAWDAERLDLLRRSLLDTQARRAGTHGGWALQGEAGLQQLAQRLRASGPPAAVAEPDGLGVRLRPYQASGLAWLQYLRAQHLGGILADEMGLGKTAQALAHVLSERQAGRLDLPALVVVPTSILFNWQAEAARVAPGLRVLVLHGADRARHFAHAAGFDLVLTTYALLWRDARALAAQPWHLLILDEAQMLKNAGARGARAVRELQARHRVCLTGTPLENHLGELWAQFDFLMPGFLGDTRSFQRLWRKPIETNGETQRAQLLAQRVRPFILRRRKADVAADLPPLTEVIERVPVQGRQRELYESVRIAADLQVRRELQRRGFAGAQIGILDALLKLRQVCCDPRLVKGRTLTAGMPSAKMERLRELLPALVAAGRRVLVFSQFTGMLALIEAELDTLQLPRLALTGRTPSTRRGAVVAQFQARAVPVLLISLKAGGLGLNLTAADTVVHVDPWWNPAVEDQATARAHRIGQDQPVFVHKLVVQGSIEERLLDLQARKRALAEGVLGRDRARALKFSAADLEGLLAPLSPV